MTDLYLAARLQSAVGDAYRLERELAGGGMSRLFVATETSLNRTVVIKVLPPELASEVSAARFKQEIEVAAHMQHPHVLPILAAGSRDDLLYYVMPFVAGETLRQRLAQGGRLPIVEAVRILREVADALAYAHRKGIVHRDIKPENILLEEGHAVLADFGVARAIVAARGGSAGNLTETGMSVGTPTYMSPEQVAGERHIDARADLYALAIVGYEMLTGQLPFSGPSAQAVLAAHLTEPPPPAVKARPDTPPAVSAALVKALAKSPDDRFRTAEEFRDALDATPVAPRTRRRWLAAAGAAALVGGAVGAALVLHHRRAPTLDPNLLAVAPFDIADPDLRLWHEGMVDILSRNLDGAGALRTVSPTVVVRRWNGRADPASASELGRATGARLAVVGSLIRSGADTVRATVSIVDVGRGRTLGEMIDRRESAAHIDRLADSLTIALLRELGRSRTTGGAQLSSVGTTSLPALKAFLQGEQFFRQSAWDSAIAYYQRAIAIDSTFSLALMNAGLAMGWQRGASDSLADIYAERAERFNHGLSPRDSFLVSAAGLFGKAFARGPQANFPAAHALLATLEAGVARYPDDPEMWYALGDARYHAGFGPVIGVPIRDVLRTFDRGIALDSAFTPAYIHPIEIGFHYGRPLGRRYLTAYLARDPTDIDADGMRLVDALTDPARAHSTALQQALDSASRDALTVAATALVEYADSAETFLRVERSVLRSTRYSNPALGDPAFIKGRAAHFLASRGRLQEALQTGLRGGSITDLGVLGVLAPARVDSMLLTDSRTPRFCGACALGYWAMRDTIALQRGLRMLDSAVRADTTGKTAVVAPYFAAMSRGYLELARHDTAAAMRTLFSLPDSLCHDCGYVWLTRAELLAAHGRYAEAARELDQVGVLNSAVGVYNELLRGRMAEKLGDNARAIDAYAWVTEMWQHADPEFQPYVSDARAGLNRLGGEHPTGSIVVEQKR